MRIAALVSALLLGLSGVLGCGTIGPPIPPEEVGLAAKIIEQKEKERKAKGAEAKPEEEDEVVLPPVRPIGTSAGSQEEEGAPEPPR